MVAYTKPQQRKKEECKKLREKRSEGERKTEFPCNKRHLFDECLVRWQDGSIIVCKLRRKWILNGAIIYTERSTCKGLLLCRTRLMFSMCSGLNFVWPDI